MQYLAMIYGEVGRWEALFEEERTAVYAGYTAFAEEAGAAGVLADGGELAATTSDHRPRSGRRDARHRRPVRGVEGGARQVLFVRVRLDRRRGRLGCADPGADHGAIEALPYYVDESEEAVA